MTQKVRTVDNKPDIQIQHKSDEGLKAAANKANAVLASLDKNKFKTAEELGLTEPQRKGLIKALKFMEEGKAPYQKYEDVMLGTVPKSGHYFNMVTWLQPVSCGTVGCIKGTVDHVMNNPHDCSVFPHLKPDGSEIGKLFFAGATNFATWNDRQNPASKITDQQAAVTLRGYLETGKTDWSHAGL